MTDPNIEAYYIRSKTRSALSKQALCRNDGVKRDPKGRSIVFNNLLNDLKCSIENFVKLPEDEARKHIHNLMICPTTKDSKERKRNNQYEKRIADVYKELGIDKISEEYHIKIRGEYISAYKANNPDCWLKSTEEYPKELRDVVQDDATLLYYIRERVILAAGLGPRQVSSIISKCLSDDHKTNYNGLMSMFFSYYEARMLKRHTKVIGRYLESMSKDKIESMNKLNKLLLRNYTKQDGTPYDIDITKYSEEMQDCMDCCSILQVDPRIVMRNPEVVYRLADCIKKMKF